MERVTIQPREDWQARVEELGLIWHSTTSVPYWNEAAYYRFNDGQIEAIVDATTECYRLLLEAGQHVIDNDLLHLFGIPAWAHQLVRDSWDAEPPALNYGRFDFAYDGTGSPKMLEFNCDTPTSLLEASIIQWDWKEAAFPAADQFNSIDEALVAKWRELPPILPNSETVHFVFASEGSGEDAVTVAYMRDVAARAGVIETLQLPIHEVGWDGSEFVDLDGRAMHTIYKLYPWEWLVNEDFGRNVVQAGTIWIEPAWKMLWSNKAILPVLWQLFPEHPNLLGAAFDLPDGAASYVRKPKLAREGANITIVREGQPIAGSDGDYGDEGYIFQDLFELPDFDGHRPIVGSWIVDGGPCGMGIREGGLITDNLARFVPHIIQ